MVPIYNPRPYLSQSVPVALNHAGSILVSMTQAEETSLVLPPLVHRLCQWWVKVPYVTCGLAQAHCGHKLLVEENGSEPAHLAGWFSMKISLMKKLSATILSVQ